MESDNDETRYYALLVEGTIVGHYRILNKIGSGGMGDVYLAQDTELDRRVALKFLSSDLCRDEDCRLRFRREAQAVAKVSHPHVIHVYEVSEHENRPFLAMEYVAGQSLKKYTSGESLTIEQIVSYAVQICEGLQAAHEQGVVHRDIKPSNVQIDSRNQAKIMDFGLAAVRETSQLTKTGSTLGTIGYMSPEQVRGWDADHRSDIFSLGVVLYELITQQHPFKRDNEAATLNAVCQDIPEPLARFKASVPERLQAIIDKALEKDAKTRYQHADDLHADLLRLRRSLVAPRRFLVASKMRRGWKTTLWLALAIVALVVIFSQLQRHIWKPESQADLSQRVMLAVLPFENLGDPEDEYFADGITDEITSRLASVRGLGVISRTSCYVYKNSAKTAPQIARELGVDYLLEGSIRWERRGDTSRVLITPQLIDAGADVHIWSDRYQRALTEIFAVQTEIAGRIVSAMGLVLGTAETEKLQTQPTENIAAFNEYLRGRYQWGKRTAAGFEKAIGHFKRTIELDSAFALAYSGLADAYSLAYAYGVLSGEESLREAERYARMAIKLDGALAEAHTALGQVKFQEAAYDSAGLLFARAIELDPNYATGHQWYADYLTRYLKVEHPDLALAEINQALKLDPLSPVINGASGKINRRLGRLDEAIEHLQATIEMEPTFANPHYDLALAYAQKGEFDDAAEELLEAVTLLSLASSSEAEALGRLYASSGWEAFWRALFEAVKPDIENGTVPSGPLLEWCLRLDFREEVYYLLEADLRRGEPWLRHLDDNPDFAAFRAEPRFRELLDRVNQRFSEEPRSH